jgi:hypothetical protein
MACLLTAWVMIGCEKEAAVEFNLIYPAAFPSNNYIASR